MLEGEEEDESVKATILLVSVTRKLVFAFGKVGKKDLKENRSV